MKRRASGILLHITSLPSPFGIGDLGPSAFHFIDFLAQSKQSYWQILPLNPTSTAAGNSPYSSYSAFAGNPLMISPQQLVKDGFISQKEVQPVPHFPIQAVDYLSVTQYKNKIVDKTFRIFYTRLKTDYEFLKFCEEQALWLEDFALFAAFASQTRGKVWHQWPPEMRDRRTSGLKTWRKKLHPKIEKEKFIQFIFFKQWKALRQYANDKNIQIIGDLPIYVQYHSADVWSHPKVFKLDSQNKPLAVAGIPPDFFSATGQLWNNPLYRWDILEKRGYDWWVHRVRHNFSLFEVVRLDHFTGFIDYWEVPVGEKTAVNGHWMKGPGEGFFNALLKHFPYLPFIAEDLGIITAKVHALRDRFELPGMRILQFAFGNDPLADFYKPSHYVKNCVAYTGTHDNDTLMSWLFGKEDYSTRKPEEIREERQKTLHYLGIRRRKPRKEIHWELIRLLMMSVANTVIFPMQDILGLGNEGRMNRPATSKGNWEWRLKPGSLNHPLLQKLSEMTECYGRD